MQVNQSLLRRWYIAVAGLSTTLAFVAIAFPRWPRAIELNAKTLNSRLNAAGFLVKSLPSRASTRSYDLASSKLLIWKLANAQELSLMRATSREYPNFQLAFLTRAQPKLQLNSRRLHSAPLPFASGNQDNKNMVQTCIVTGSKGQSALGVSHEQLNLAQTRFSSSLPERLLTFFIMAPPTRNSCIVVTLSSPRTSPKPDLLLFKKIIDTITDDITHHDSTISHAPQF
jgi:hypothetical protein